MAPTQRPCPDNCGDMVIRARTEAMKWQLLNPEPDPAGNVAVRIDPRDNVFARTLRRGEEPVGFEKIYMPHKATCRAEQSVRAQRAGGPPGSSSWRSAAARHQALLRARRAQRRRPQPAGYRYVPRRPRG